MRRASWSSTGSRTRASSPRASKACSDLKEVTPTQYTADFETKVAYIKFKFEVTVEMTRADRPDAIEAKIEGKPHGIVGRLSATSAATFVEEDGGEPTIQYAIEANLTGRLGSIGQPVLKSKAKEMERQFVENLRAGFRPACRRPRRDAVRMGRAANAQGSGLAARSRRSDARAPSPAAPR